MNLIYNTFCVILFKYKDKLYLKINHTTIGIAYRPILYITVLKKILNE